MPTLERGAGSHNFGNNFGNNCWVSGFGFRVSGFNFWVLRFEFRGSSRDGASPSNSVAVNSGLPI